MPHPDPLKPHHRPGGFRNPARLPNHGAAGLLRWQWERLRAGGARDLSHDLKVARGPHSPLDPPEGGAVTWVGQSCFLVQFAGASFLTDPHMGPRASPVGFAGPARLSPPGLTVAELPPLDFVLLSHDHYDHLDEGTVLEIRDRFGDRGPTWYVPLGLRAWLERRGVRRVVELDWWEGAEHGDWRIDCAPVQHFSGRGLWDRNSTLWCGWMATHPGLRFYFAGDTGYSGDFAATRERLGAPDLAAIPIGAYDPRWFMSPVHVDPGEAVRIHRDLGARRSLGMHWGTFVLTDEPVMEPPRRLARALEDAGVPAGHFLTLPHGETRPLAQIFGA